MSGDRIPAGGPDRERVADRHRPSRRRRALSAALWSGVGFLTVLAIGAGYRLAGGALPAGLAGLVPLAVAVGSTVAGVTYAVEHRIARRGR